MILKEKNVSNFELKRTSRKDFFYSNQKIKLNFILKNPFKNSFFCLKNYFTYEKKQIEKGNIE